MLDQAVDDSLGRGELGLPLFRAVAADIDGPTVVIQGAHADLFGAIMATSFAQAVDTRYAESAELVENRGVGVSALGG